jgi:uncharacterized membrane protein YjgN (DUF898 family)
MTGSGVAYAIRSFAWLLLVILTLGALYPWREASLERYKMRNTFYGDLQGRFVGKGWSLFKAGAWIWLICLIAVLGPWLYFGVEVTIAKITHADDPLAAQKAGARLGLVALLGMFTPLVGLALWPIFQAIEWKWWLEGLRFGEVSFRSDLRRSRLVGIYLGLFGVILGMMVGFGILGGVGAYAFKDQLKAFATSIAVGPMVYFVVLYLAFLVLFGAFYRYFLQFRVWKTVVKSVAIRNLDDVDDVQARGVAVNALGEGLVDGLDVAGF